MKQYYSYYWPKAIAGQSEGSIALQRVRAYVNRRGTPQVWTIVIPGTPAAGTEFAVTINATATARYQTDETPTQVELRDGLLNAIRMNPVFGVFSSADLVGNSITLTSANPEDNILIAVSGTGLTASVTQASSVGSEVEFGRFVARPAGSTDYKIAQIPLNVTDKILGITRVVRDIERTDIRESTTNVRTTYKSGDVMDIVERTGESGGIYMQCVEADINPNDNLYCSVTAGTQGMATKNNTGTIDLSSRGAFQGEAIQTREGNYIVLVTFNNS